MPLPVEEVDTWIMRTLTWERAIIRGANTLEQSPHPYNRIPRNAQGKDPTRPTRLQLEK